jgi:hypothetical protein
MSGDAPGPNGSVKRLGRIVAVVVGLVGIAAIVVPVAVHELIDYRAVDQRALIDLGPSRQIVGTLSYPRYMHVGDSRLVETTQYRETLSPVLKCELSATGFVQSNASAEGGNCAWNVSANAEGSKMIIATVIVGPPKRTFSGWDSIRVGQSPFSAASIGILSAGVALIGSVVGLYLKLTGKRTPG